MTHADRVVLHFLNCGCLSPQTKLVVILLSGFLVILYSRDLLVLETSFRKGTAVEVVEDKRIDMCKASTRHPIVFNKQYPKDRSLSSLLEGPGLDNFQHNDYAACKFLFDDHSGHFPHAMQQLYKCVSFWNADRNKEAWLVMQKQPLREQVFVRGFLDAIQDVRGVKIVRFRHTLQVARPIVDYGYDVTSKHLGYALHSPDDLEELRTELYQKNHLQTSNVAGCVVKGGPTDDKKTVPRIRRRRVPNLTILNRWADNGRRLLNARDLKDAIQTRFNLTTVRVVEFEQASVLQQVQMMGETDIVLSPHGAQLTSLPFLPTCGRVIEIFGLGYYVPQFFGRLAHASGEAYSHVYAGGNDMEHETQVWMQSLETRSVARQLPICPEMETILRHVQQEIAAWKRCCTPYYQQ